MAVAWERLIRSIPTETTRHQAKAIKGDDIYDTSGKTVVTDEVVIGKHLLGPLAQGRQEATADTLLDHGASVATPKIAQDDEADYEGELCFVIGRDAKEVSREDSLSYVAAYTCGNDVSSTKLQRDPAFPGVITQWGFSKGFDTFALRARGTLPHVWQYPQIRPSLLGAGELVCAEQAGRRVLMLASPGREPPFTTDTLYGGLRLVVAGETARAHRHTAFAMRFVIEDGRGDDGCGSGGGGGGFTAVHGGRIAMRGGDVIVHAALELARPRKADGSEVSKTLGGAATRVDARKETPVVQETASSVYHVVQGSGHTTGTIGGKRFAWEQSDTFCIPHWYPYQHFASDNKGGAPVYLYRFDDKPMLSSLGFYSTAEMDIESLVSA
ncbi:hypothetical protein diail_7708 [Diaporthe ilicicola]|nr:hypothetical protein diail_7708 [Diaporthe ilicicola]